MVLVSFLDLRAALEFLSASVQLLLLLIVCMAPEEGISAVF